MILKGLTKQLPSKEKFYNSLASKKIRDKEYVHVLKIWNRSEMKTIRYYHDFYLKLDVLLIHNVFEKFRNDGLKIMDYFQVIIGLLQL